MNTSKRLLSVFICLVMVLSMMATSFASTGAVADASGSEAPVVNNAATVTGANPTTDVASPVIDDNTIVVDANAVEGEEYVLEWEGQEYGPYTIIDGEEILWFDTSWNLATSVKDALLLAKELIDGNIVETPTIIVKSATDTTAPTITTRVNMYTDAYNTMPFVVGTAFDGSDWVENPDFAAKSVILNEVIIAVSNEAYAGDVGLYGFTLKGNSYTYDLNGTTVAGNYILQNTKYISADVASEYTFSWGTFAQSAAAATSNVVVKNFHFSGVVKRFITEEQPNNVVIDGLWVPNGSKLVSGGIPYIKQGRNQAASKLTYKNWNIQNGGSLAFYFQAVQSGGSTVNWMSNSSDANIPGASSNFDFRSVEFSNCIFNETRLFSDVFLYTYGNGISKWTFDGNRIINTSGTTYKFMKNNSATYANHMSMNFTNNYVVGYSYAASFASSVGNGTTQGIYINDNYFAQTNGGAGTEFWVDSTKDTKDWHAKDWYLDADMTTKASTFVTPSDVSITEGIALVTGSSLTAYIPQGGSAADISVKDATLAWKDTAGAAVNASDITAGDYIVTVTKEIAGVAYSVDFAAKLALDDGTHFSNTFVDPEGLIDAKKAVIISKSFRDIAKGTAIKAQWDGQEYTFIKGVNAFTWLGDANDGVYPYMRANGIEEAHYLILDVDGGKGDTMLSPQIEMPGRYFTPNYNVPVYSKSDAETDPFGLEWKSNVNTGEAGSYNTANGITLKYCGFGHAVKGKYELYGFNVKYQIEMTNSDGVQRPASESIDLTFANCYLQPTSGVNFITGSYNSVANAKAYNDSLTFKDSFFGAANTTGFYRSDAFPPANFTLDGVFADFGGQTMVNTYLHQYGDFYSFNIKNCNFRNGKMPLYIRGRFNSGDNNKVEDSKVLNISDNIFYDFSLYGDTNFGAFYLCGFNKFDFNNNKLYARSANSGLYYPGYATYGQGAESHPDIKVSVKNNTLIGINGQPTIGRWLSAAKSSVAYNFVTSIKDDPADGVEAAGEALTIKNTSSQGANGYLYSEDYYLDYAKTTLASALDGAMELKVPGGGFYKNGSTATIYLSTGYTLADVAPVSEDAVLTWTDVNGNAIDAGAVTKASVGSGISYKAKIKVGDLTVAFDVTVLPNTITGYAASVYARDDSGKNVPTHPSEKTTLEDIPHLSGGFVDESGLINSSNAAFIDGDATYKSSATYYGKFITVAEGEAEKSVQSGDFKVFTWNDQQYVSMYNTNFFGTVDNAYSALKAKGIEAPEYLIAAGEWGQYIGNYYSTNTANYEIRVPGKYFTPNYATSPYIKGDSKGNGWVSNIGTGEGQFNPDNSIKVGALYFSKSKTAISGRYEFYGFTIARGIKDERPADDTTELDVYLKNTYFENTSGEEGAYILSAGSANTTNGDNRDTLVIDNAYYTAGYYTTFLRNQGWANMTFDGLYADFTNQFIPKKVTQDKLDAEGNKIQATDEETGEPKVDADGNPVYEKETITVDDTSNITRYFQQVYDESKLEFKNSFFTGGTEKARTYFEGYNGLGVKDGDGKVIYVGEGKKQLIFDNNIFVNYDFGGEQFMYSKTHYMNEFIFTNNYINNEGKNYPITSSTSEKGETAEYKLVITDNTLIGFNGKFASDYLRDCTSDSQIANNFTAATADSVGIPFGNVSNVVAGDYYLDSAKEILASELTIKEWPGAELSVIGGKFTAVYTGDDFDVSDIVYNTDKELTTTWYSDKALTTELESLDNFSGTAFLKIATTTASGMEVYNVYEVAVIVVTDNMFSDVYVAPETDSVKTKIDASKALLVDFGSNDYGYGALYTTTWQGVEYDFLKGINVFGSFNELNTFLATAGIEFPHVLLKTVSTSATNYDDIKDYGVKAVSELQIKYHGAYYTENYNIVPYVIEEDGTWVANPEYDRSNGIVARWIKPNAKLGYGDIELYGFTVTAAFQNSCNENAGLGAVEMYIENCLAADPVGYDTQSTPFHSHSDYSRTTGAEKLGSLYIKNTYVESTDNKRALIYQADTIGELTFDGVYLDGKGYDKSGWAEDSFEQDSTHMHALNSVITIKNSNLSNFKQALVFAIISEDVDTTGSEHAIVLENNIINNVSFGDTAFIEIDGQYTDVALVNNTIVNDFNTKLINVIEHVDYSDLNDDDEYTEDEIIETDKTSEIALNIVVQDNILIGFENIHVTDRALDAASVIDGNMTALVDMGGKVLTFISGETVIKDANFKVDIDGKIPGNVVQGMTVEGNAFDEDGAVANVEVAYTETEINLNKYLVNKYNVVEYYADADMTVAIDDVTAMALDTAAIYIKVFAADGESDQQTRTITFAIGEIPQPEIEKVSATLYNDISMNFKTVGTDLYEGVYAEFEVAGKTYKVTESTVDGDYIVFSFDGLAPHRMNDNIKATIFATVEGVAGTEIATYETSMADYLYQIKAAITDDAELTKLVIDTLNYGAAAQQYKGYNVENLANAGLTDAEKVIADVETVDNLDKEYNFADYDYTAWKSIGLYLDEAIDMKLGFDIVDKDAVTLDDISLLVYNDGEYEEVLTDCFVYRDGKFQIYFDNFNVSQVDEVFYFTLVNADGEFISNTVAYSVESYAHKAITLGNESLQNIAKALMNYGRSALAYNNK